MSLFIPGGLNLRGKVGASSWRHQSLPLKIHKKLCSPTLASLQWDSICGCQDPSSLRYRDGGYFVERCYAEGVQSFVVFDFHSVLNTLGRASFDMVPCAPVGVWRGKHENPMECIVSATLSECHIHIQELRFGHYEDGNLI